MGESESGDVVVEAGDAGGGVGLVPGVEVGGVESGVWWPSVFGCDGPVGVEVWSGVGACCAVVGDELDDGWADGCCEGLWVSDGVAVVVEVVGDPCSCELSVVFVWWVGRAG